VWLGGRVVRMLDLRSTGREFESWPPRCRVQPWASCWYTCASVAKQYNLVPANGRWCLTTGKVTIGLASYWPCLTDISGSPPMGSRPRGGRWAPTYTLLWSMVDFTFTFTPGLARKPNSVPKQNLWGLFENFLNAGCPSCCLTRIQVILTINIKCQNNVP